MAQYSFPVLEDSELLPCLEEMEIPLDASQLAKPTYETVKVVFENVLLTMGGVTRDELVQPVFTAIDAFEYPELHDESVACLNFFHHLSKLLVASGVKDFSLRDIYKPEAPRLRRHLSAIVNFAKFREEKLIAYTEVQQRIESLIEAKRALEAESAAKASELRRMHEARAAEAQDAKAVEEEVSELYAVNAGLNKMQAALNAEVRSLKAQANSLADEAAAAKLELASAKAKGEQLAGQIVSSPEKFQRTLVELQAAVDAERELVTDQERASRDLQARMDGVGKVEKEVAKCVKLMEEADGDICRKKDASKVVKDMRAAIEGQQAELEALGAQQAHLKRQQASLLERIQRLEHQAGLKMEAAESYVEEQLKAKEAVEAENAAVEARLAENEAAVRGVRERIKELQAAHGAQVAGVMDRFALLRKTVSDYNAVLEGAITAGSK